VDPHGIKIPKEEHRCGFPNDAHYALDEIIASRASCMSRPTPDGDVVPPS
jgi:hypothetical protein